MLSIPACLLIVVPAGSHGQLGSPNSTVYFIFSIISILVQFAVRVRKGIKYITKAPCTDGAQKGAHLVASLTRICYVLQKRTRTTAVENVIFCVSQKRTRTCAVENVTAAQETYTCFLALRFGVCGVVHRLHTPYEPVLGTQIANTGCISSLFTSFGRLKLQMARDSMNRMTGNAIRGVHGSAKSRGLVPWANAPKLTEFTVAN